DKVKDSMVSSDDPFMLVINVDFKTFDPSVHPWSIIWFSDFRADASRLYRVFRALALRVRQGENVFQYLHRLAKRRAVAKWLRYVRVDVPGLFGVSIDVEAIFADLVVPAS